MFIMKITGTQHHIWHHIGSLVTHWLNIIHIIPFPLFPISSVQLQLSLWEVKCDLLERYMWDITGYQSSCLGMIRRAEKGGAVYCSLGREPLGCIFNASCLAPKFTTTSIKQLSFCMLITSARAGPQWYSAVPMGLWRELLLFNVTSQC